MSQKIRPLNDRVVVRREKPQEKSAGGIFIPDSAKEKPLEVIVVAVGPGRFVEGHGRVEPSVKTGDRVLIGKYTGVEALIDGVEHLVVREDDIVGVLG